MYCPIRLIIADDTAVFNQTFIDAIRCEPSVEVIAVAENAQQLLELADRHQPDVVLIELHLPSMSGVDAAGIIKEKHPNIGIVVIGLAADAVTVSKAFHYGIGAYLYRKSKAEVFIEAIQKVSKGEIYYGKNSEHSFYYGITECEKNFSLKSISKLYA